MRRALAAGLATLGLAAAFAWGCASHHEPVAERPHDWQRYVPDGGWATYVPVPDPNEPHPMEAAAGTYPHVDPFPVLPSGNQITVH